MVHRQRPAAEHRPDGEGGAHVADGPDGEDLVEQHLLVGGQVRYGDLHQEVGLPGDHVAGDDRRDRGEGGLLLLSGLIALVFTRLGTRAGSATGVAGYTAAGLGPRAGQAAAWCFLAGVVTGAPVVCLIGGAYVAELLGAGGRTAYVAALCRLVLVLAVRLGGVRTGTGLQLVLVAVLVTLVVVAVAGAAPGARAAHWTPFAPGGRAGTAGRAAAGRDRRVRARARRRHRGRPDAGRHPRLPDGGHRAGDRPGRRRGHPARDGGVLAAVAATSALLLRAAWAGLVTTAQLVTVPTALFLLVYLGCLAAAVRLLTGAVRLAAGAACAVVALLLAGSGWAALVAAGVAVVAGTRGRPDPSARVRSRAPESRHNPEAGRSEPVDPGPASDVCGQSVTGP